MRSAMPEWEHYLNDHQTRYVDELSQFLPIPGISGQPEDMKDVRIAADWLTHRLDQAGPASIEVLETGRHPPGLRRPVQCPRSTGNSDLLSRPRPTPKSPVVCCLTR